MRYLLDTTLIFKILFGTIYVISAIILILLAVLIVHNIYNKRREKKRQEYSEKYIDIISSYVTGESIEIDRLETNLQYETFADVADNAIVDISGKEVGKVHRLLKELDVVEHFKDKTRSASWLKRYAAIDRLSLFKMPELKPFFMNFVDHETRPELKVKGLIALSLIADRDIIYYITEKLSEIYKNEDAPVSEKLIEHMYTNAIKSLKAKNMQGDIITLLNDIKSNSNIPASVKVDLMNACGAMSLKESSAVVVDYYNTHESNVEVRAAAIRVIGRICDTTAKDIIMKSLYDENWVIRLAAVKGAQFCADGAIPRLRELLSDPVYHVRMNAAKTLANIGSKGLQILEIERNSKDDEVKNTISHVMGLRLNPDYYSEIAKK